MTLPMPFSNISVAAAAARLAGAACRLAIARAVSAVALAFLCGIGPTSIPAGAQDRDASAERAGTNTNVGNSLDEMLARLADPETENGPALAAEIRARWARSGSPTLDLLLSRGRDALAAGHPKRAIGHLTALLDTYPGFVEGRFSRAEAFFLIGRPGMALDDLARALALEPRHFPSWALMGVILAEIGETEGARAALSHAFTLNPHDGDVAAALAHVERLLKGEPV